MVSETSIRQTLLQISMKIKHLLDENKCIQLKNIKTGNFIRIHNHNLQVVIMKGNPDGTETC